jgi:CDP-diacylglycerol--serine O-phosphatidyltransferase
MFVAGLYVCAGTMRLARFNVLSRRDEAAGHKAPGKYMLGLSIPASASVLVLMVIVAHNVGFYAWVSQGFVAVIVLALSYLMVSRVHFRSFKDVRLTKRTVGLLTLLVGSAVVVALAGVDKAVVFLLLITAYILLGFTETMILIKRHFSESRRLRHAQHAAAAAAAMVTTPGEDKCSEEEPPADEEVLRELGAFDEPETEPRR